MGPQTAGVRIEPRTNFHFELPQILKNLLKKSLGVGRRHKSPKEENFTHLTAHDECFLTAPDGFPKLFIFRV